MTTLVLDNPDLLARAARIDSSLLQQRPPVAVTAPVQTLFYYACNAHRLTDLDAAVLEQHGNYLAAHPNQKLRIHGHADAEGKAEYNEFLARLRATTAARLIRRSGARETQIDCVGWGSTVPLKSLSDYAYNRRIELQYLTAP